MFFSSWFRGNKSKSQKGGQGPGGVPDRHSPHAGESARHASARTMEPARDRKEMAEAAAAATARKSERLARREQLYGVVRNCMVRSGVLNSGYKFKVLSLDPKGRQFLVMIDLQHSYAKDVGRLAEMEALMVERAKAHFEMVVTAVYWRLSDHPELKKAGDNRTSSPVAAQAERTDHAEPPVDPDALHDEELIAFHRALNLGLDSPMEAAQAAADTQRQKAQMAGYADTEISDRDVPIGALGATQYGEIR
jgi:hypothetical protein